MTAKLISAKELAVRYSVSAKTIRKWGRCALLPVVKLNCRCIRFDVEACDTVIYRRTRIAGLSPSPTRYRARLSGWATTHNEQPRNARG